MKEIKKNERPVVAIDLGGTKILAALVSVKNKVAAREYQPTLADGGQRAVVDRIFEPIDRLLGKSGIKASRLEAIGIAAAGAIDSAKGLVTSSPHLPDWRDVPLKQIVARMYKVDAFIINDASAAALGEHRLGAGRGVGNLVYLTVSTGIGGGIIINGRLYLGSSGSAGELGHMTIDVNGRRDRCGNIGCLELLASGTAIAEEAGRRLKEGQTSALKQIAAGGIESITAEDVAAAAQSGDLLSRDVIHQAAHYLGVGMVNIVNIFNPDMIIVGGGVARMGELLLEPVRQVVLKRAFELPARAVRIVTAQLGDDAGVLGAAIFAREQKVGAA